MILDQISYIDCIVFVFFLIPQLLININIFELIYCGLRLLPFLSKLWKHLYDGFSSCDPGSL